MLQRLWFWKHFTTICKVWHLELKHRNIDIIMVDLKAFISQSMTAQSHLYHNAINSERGNGQPGRHTAWFTS